MADLDLRTDYKDDILDSSVNTKRKYNIIDNEDGTKSLEDVSEYAQRGDSFGAVDINKTNQAVLDLNQSLSVDFSNSTATSLNQLLQYVADNFFPLRLYLYDKGNTFDDITGGWVASGSYKTANPNNDGKLYLYGENVNNGVGYYQCKNQVSIPSGATKLHISNIEGYVNQFGAFGLYIDGTEIALGKYDTFTSTGVINYVNDDYVIDVTGKSSVKVGLYIKTGSSQKAWISCESIYVD